MASGANTVDLREVPSESFQRHPWEVARSDFFVGLLSSRALTAGPGPVAVLDVGAGDGFLAGQLLARLPAGSEVVCFDPNYDDEHLARGAASAPAGLSFARQRPQRPFDLLMLLDVAEHVPDDTAFLGELAGAALRPGGQVLISVPAWMSLFSRHDVALGHYRRYKPAELRALVARAGLQLEANGGLFHSLILPRALAKGRELVTGVRSRPDPEQMAVHADTELGRWGGGRALSVVVRTALRADNGLSRLAAAAGVDLPGLSVWALARKP